MKRVLILAYDYPPYPSIAGQRPASWYRYFKEFGIEPVVVTRHWDVEFKNHIDCFRESKNQTVTTTIDEKGTIIRVPYRQNVRDKMLTQLGERRFVLVRKVFSFLLENLKFHSFLFDNRYGIYDAARKALAEQRFDAIIATAEPFILFRYAQLLSKEFGVPWIADYRDLWSSDLINPPKSWIDKVHWGWLERKIVSGAALMTTASPSYKPDLERFFPGKKVEVIYNGYDDDTLESLPEIPQDEQTFRIAYAGTIYPFQHVETFLAGFHAFIREEQATNARIAFYGIRFYPEQVQRITSFHPSLAPYFEFTGKISYSETLMNLKKASVLLLLGSQGKLAAKTFDYLALQRMILLTPNDHSVMERIVKDSRGGIVCESAEEVCAALVRCYREHKVKGKVEHRSVSFEEYSRRQQAKKLAAYLSALQKKKSY